MYPRSNKEIVKYDENYKEWERPRSGGIVYVRSKYD